MEQISDVKTDSAVLNNNRRKQSEKTNYHSLIGSNDATSPTSKSYAPSHFFVWTILTDKVLGILQAMKIIVALIWSFSVKIADVGAVTVSSI